MNNIIDNALALISPLTGNLNVNNNQLTNFRLQNGTADLAAGQEGRILYRTDQDHIKVDDGAAIRFVPTMLAPALGTLIVAGGATGYVNLAVGANGRVLTARSSVTATGVTWEDPAGVLAVQVFS